MFQLQHSKTKLCTLLCMLSIAIPGLAFVNNSDSNKPLSITSESAAFNRSTGVGTYERNVEIDQGTTHVRGDVVKTIQEKDNKLKEIIINGSANKQAYYEALVEPNKPKLVATANQIRYFPKKMQTQDI